MAFDRVLQGFRRASDVDLRGWGCVARRRALAAPPGRLGCPSWSGRSAGRSAGIVLTGSAQPPAVARRSLDAFVALKRSLQRAETPCGVDPDEVMRRALGSTCEPPSLGVLGHRTPATNHDVSCKIRVEFLKTYSKTGHTACWTGHWLRDIGLRAAAMRSQVSSQTTEATGTWS